MIKTSNLTLTALDPIHHGAGVAGNTSLLRTQEIVSPDGNPTVVPFISGNSIRHSIRAGAARHALRTMAVEPNSLSKSLVDLLFSGGALTKSGANEDLEARRKVAELFPALTLLGYSAGSSMVAGKLRVDNLHLVCRENAWRLPSSLADSPQATKSAGSFRSEEFGTRHDVARTADGAHYTSWLSYAETTQMIYDFQVIKAGATLFGALHVEDPTELEEAALTAALKEIAGDGFIKVGAKSAIGLGRTSVTGLPEAVDLTAYETLLAEHSDTIVAVLEDLVA